jgi:hypothetical protein
MSVLQVKMAVFPRIEPMRVRVFGADGVIRYGSLFQKQIQIWVKFDGGSQVDKYLKDPSITSIDVLDGNTSPPDTTPIFFV